MCKCKRTYTCTCTDRMHAHAHAKYRTLTMASVIQNTYTYTYSYSQTCNCVASRAARGTQSIVTSNPQSTLRSEQLLWMGQPWKLDSMHCCAPLGYYLYTTDSG